MHTDRARASTTLVEVAATVDTTQRAKRPERLQSFRRTGTFHPARTTHPARAKSRVRLRSALQFIVISLLAIIIAGCTITIEGGGDGHLVLVISNIPDDVRSLRYTAQHDNGWHTSINVPIEFRGNRVTKDLGSVASGVWHIEVRGLDRNSVQLYVHKLRVHVVGGKQHHVRVFDWRTTHASERWQFIGHNMHRGLLENYSELFDGFIVHRIAESTGLRPFDSRPHIHLYGTEDTWQEARCGNTSGCYDPVGKDIHVNGGDGGGMRTKPLTEAYVHWLAEHEGYASTPSWFIVGLARNEAERIHGSGGSGNGDWNNEWVREQWDEVRSARHEAVPRLATYRRADKYTFTAVAHLLQTRGGQWALTDFFALTYDGYEFNDAFTYAFGITPGDYQYEYEGEVWRLRDGRR